VPLMNAAGCLGFSPHARVPVELSQFGAFITNPISLKPRKPARQAGLYQYPGGVMLHSGFPNPGLKATVRRNAQRWQRADVPVIIHLLGESTAELAGAVRSLEEMENILGLEIGLADDTPLEAAVQVVQLALGELPLMVRLPMLRFSELAAPVMEAGASLVSLSPPRGALQTPDGAIQTGRLYGPGIFPLALQTVQALAAQGIPVVGVGGIYRSGQAQAMLAAGAIAVQVDTALWRGYWENETAPMISAI